MSLVRYTVIAIVVGAAISPGGQPDTTAAAPRSWRKWRQRTRHTTRCTSR